MMYMQSLIRNTLSILAVCLLTNTAIAADDASPTESSRQIIVDAKKQSLDIANNTLSFLGDVEIKQGNMQIKADKLDVIRGEQSHSETLIATGNPTVFTHELEDGNKISAQADKMTYSVQDNILTLEGNASISQQDSQVTSDRIEYNVKLKKMIASANENSDSRVRTVLIPGK